ncbi:MAG: M23 family metallopeptidase, partial [bacterium]|nr:M23 family metallopeptidase [bacterium]
MLTKYIKIKDRASYKQLIAVKLNYFAFGRILFFFLIIGLSQLTYAQYTGTATNTEKNTEKKQGEKQEDGIKTKKFKKYRWPLNINNGYSSSFQEFRSSHFHGGIDLRTFQKTGYPVYAITDGSVYKIKMTKRGAGKGLFFKHSDGNTSIYYHLDRFSKALETISKKVRQQKGKKYFGDYTLKNPLQLKRGQLLAYAGETGAGFAHLHLEIRDKYYYAINPFDRIEIPGRDRVPP